MWRQYLLENNDSPETIPVKFKHCNVIQIRIVSRGQKTFHTIPIRTPIKIALTRWPLLNKIFEFM